MSERRSSTVCAVVGRRNYHCGNDLVSDEDQKLLIICTTENETLKSLFPKLSIFSKQAQQKLHET